MNFTTEVKTEAVQNSDIFIYNQSVYIKQHAKIYRMRTRERVTIPNSHSVHRINNMDIADLCALILSMKSMQL